jgi:hypothetical protein
MDLSHAEYAYDAVQRVAMNWRDLYPAAAKALK